MKIVTYQDKKKFILTDREFDLALDFWEMKQNYYCKRLDASLSHFYLYIDTPAKERGWKIYLHFWDGNMEKLYCRPDGKWVEILSPSLGGGIMVRESDEVPPLEDMVSQEDYYDSQPGGILASSDNNKLLT